MAVTLRKLVEAKKLNEEKTIADQIDDLSDKVDDIGDDINADQAIIADKGVITDDGDVFSGRGVIEDTLDRALKVNERINKRNGDNFVNVLFIGEAGTGKTSRIRAWASKNGINLFEVRAAGMDDTDLGGAITPDKEGNAVHRLASTEFDRLGQPRSILFLDEYNRAPQSVRTNLLELINSHVVPDPREASGQRKLKGYLFTIAAINPADIGYNTDALDAAELSRFMAVSVPAEKKNLLDYLVHEFNKQIKNADEDEKLELERKIALTQKILSSKEFKFDSTKDIQDVQAGRGLANILNNRTLTQLLLFCDGTKDDFLDNWDRFCNPAKKPMITAILKDYVDIDDKANDALKSHDSESTVFKQEKRNLDKIIDILGNI